MTERVLTDAEIHEIVGYNNWPTYSPAPIDVARAVEAAVLAKVAIKNQPWGERVFTEREARRRERAAYKAGAGLHGAGVEWIRETIDNYYPLPTCDKCGQELP